MLTQSMATSRVQPVPRLPRQTAARTPLNAPLPPAFPPPAAAGASDIRIVPTSSSAPLSAAHCRCLRSVRRDQGVCGAARKTGTKGGSGMTKDRGWRGILNGNANRGPYCSDVAYTVRRILVHQEPYWSTNTVIPGYFCPGLLKSGCIHPKLLQVYISCVFDANVNT